MPTPPAPQAPRGRALLVERAAGGLAHEAKNPLHNMVLHLQLVAEKLPSAEAPALERHIQAMRDGIGRVDALLRAFSQLATPPVHSAADLGQAVSRALLLFGFEARRGNVQLTRHGPSELPVEGDGALVDELVCHAVLAGIVLAQDGTLELSIVPEGTRARLDLRGEGLAARRVDALPHLEEVRRLTSELQIERSIDADSAPVARLSLMFAQSR